MLEVKQSTLPNCGYGAFATTDIPVNTIICEYTGLRVKSGADCSNRDKSFRLSNGTTILGTGPASYINDDVYFRKLSYQETRDLYLARVLPRRGLINCRFIETNHTIYVVSTRAIPSGDELFADYGHLYWRSRFVNSGLVDCEFMLARL